VKQELSRDPPGNVMLSGRGSALNWSETVLLPGKPTPRVTRICHQIGRRKSPVGLPKRPNTKDHGVRCRAIRLSQKIWTPVSSTAPAAIDHAIALPPGHSAFATAIIRNTINAYLIT
jgi:hypothetical protein